MAEPFDAGVEVHQRGLSSESAHLALIENAGFKIDEIGTGYAPGPKSLMYLFEGGARINRKVYFPFNRPQDFASTSARFPSDDRHGREVLKLGGIIDGRKFRTVYRFITARSWYRNP
jgi:hypothetical protein